MDILAQEQGLFNIESMSIRGIFPNFFVQSDYIYSVSVNPAIFNRYNAFVVVQIPFLN